MKFLIQMLFIILVSLFAVRSLLGPGFFPMHDDTQPSRVYEMHQALNGGQLPVRWVSDLGYGYGYPIFNFYAPFAYYVGGIIAFFGINYIDITKILFVIPVILSGIGMYLLAQQLFGKYAAIVSTVAYVYAPYHALDIYVRGDLSEVWAYAFIPFVFYASWKILEGKKWRYAVLGSLSYAGLILSHNLIAFMMSGFLALFLLVTAVLSYRRKSLFSKKLIVVIIMGVLLSAFYWIPALSELKYTNISSQIGGGADYKDHFVCPMQFWDSPWGFGGSSVGCIDGMSFRIGKVHIVLTLMAIFLSLLMLARKAIDAEYVLNPKGIFFVFSTFGVLVSVFLMLPQSRFIWDILPVMAYFQYPWRFLVSVSFFSSILCGFSVWLAAKSASAQYHWRYFSSYLITSVVCVAIIFAGYRIFSPQTINNKSDMDYIDGKSLSWDISKISDEYMPRHFEKPNNSNDVVSKRFSVKSKDATIYETRSSITKFSAQIKSAQGSDVVVHIAYFPGWHLFLDNMNKNFTANSKGFLVKVPPGEHMLEARFSQTTIEVVSNLLSIIGLLCLFLGIIPSIRRFIYE